MNTGGSIQITSRVRRTNHPVTTVSWYDAMAYAAWLGGSLPTEAQWELAARGQVGRHYPWGDEAPTRAHANYNRVGTTPTGEFPAGATPEGVYDLAGERVGVVSRRRVAIDGASTPA